MIVNVKDLVSYAIKKQFKISHVPCEVMVFDKDEIPESIKSKIEDQYDEKFLDDSDKVIFFKGPIDKDMVQKLFKAVDKALGEDSNKLVVGDFKLLKVADVDDGFQIGGDEDEEAPEEDGITDEPEEDKPAPTSDDEVTDDEVNDVLDADEANEKAAEDAEDVEQPDAREADEQVEESMDDDRHGLSLDDILKLGNKHAAERNAAIAADKKDQLDRQNQLKRIWVKDIFIDKSNDNNSYADMQLTYADGSTTESRRSISTTGTSSVDDHDPVYTDLEKRGYKIGGERMRNYDKLYREYKDQIRRNMGKQGGLPKGEEIKDEDIRIASLGHGFPPGIEWVYGELQLHTPWYAFSYRTQPSPEAVTYMQRSDTKTWMDAVKSQKALERAGRARPLYSYGNTKIYRIHEDEDENAEGAREEVAADAGLENGGEHEETTPEAPTRYVMLKVSLKS